MTIEKVLAREKRRNNGAKIEALFEKMYYDYSSLVAFIVSKYVKKREDVEEIVNDVFIKLSRTMMTTEILNLKGYLVTSAKNASIDFIKRKENKLNVVYDDEFISSVGDEKNDDSSFNDLINMMRTILSDKEIKIILEVSVYNKSFVEIAKRRNQPVTTISSIYHRAIKKFKKGIPNDFKVSKRY